MWPEEQNNINSLLISELGDFPCRQGTTNWCFSALLWPERLGVRVGGGGRGGSTFTGVIFSLC